MYDYFRIQSQRIYSLINCPNCLYTWKLISKYYRELVLEGWALFITNIISDSRNQNLKIGELLDRFYDDLDVYLPLNKPKIEDCFIHITSKVNNENKVYITNSKYSKIFWSVDGSKKRFLSLKLGAFPFTSLKMNQTNSGIKYDPVITIQDPELKYLKFSITKYLDAAFDFILQKLNDFLTSHSGIRIYLKRTIAGTEFGVCFQPFTSDEKQNLFTTLHDNDLTFIAAINVKSEKILLVSILLLLGCILGACFSMIEVIIFKLAQKGIKGILKMIFEEIIDQASDWLNDNVVEMICGFFIIKTKNLLKDRFYGSKIQLILKEFMEFDISSTVLGNLKGGKFFAMGAKIIVSIIMYITAFFSSFLVQTQITNQQSINEISFDDKQLTKFEKQGKYARNSMDKSGFIIENENEVLKDPKVTLKKSIEKSSSTAKSYEIDTNIEQELVKIQQGKQLKEYIE